jgi:hypothetical protein
MPVPVPGPVIVPMAVRVRVVMGVVVVPLVAGRGPPAATAADHAGIRRRAGAAESPSRVCSVWETA